jgi:enamine deaminase RidA (YjgF/YER057c/UK114 family)
MTVENVNPDGVRVVEGISQVSVAKGSRIIFFSGQVGAKPDGTPAGDDLRSQACQAHRNLETVATGVGVKPEDVAKWTLFIKDYSPELFDEYMAGYGDYLEKGGTFAPVTAGTLVGVTALWEPWCVMEIEAIAVAD